MPWAAVILSTMLGQAGPTPGVPDRPADSPSAPSDPRKVEPPAPPVTTRPPAPPPDRRIWRDVAGIGGELVLSASGLLLGMHLCATGPEPARANCGSLWPHAAAGAALGAWLGATAGVYLGGRLLGEQGNLLASLAGAGAGTLLASAAIAVGVGALGMWSWAAILLGAVAFFLPSMGAAIGFDWKRKPEPPRTPTPPVIAPAPSRLPLERW